VEILVRAGLIRTFGDPGAFDHIGEDVVSPFLWSHGLKRIDTVVLTHPHEDHLGGMFAVLRNFKVGELWVGCDEDAPAYRNLLAEAKTRNVLSCIA
jgi:competence protein ComEC